MGRRERRRPPALEQLVLPSPPHKRKTRRGCPRRVLSKRDHREGYVLGRPGGDLLFQALRLRTIGAGEFNDRVRDGIGFLAPRYYHQAGEGRIEEASGERKRAAQSPDLIRGPRAAYAVSLSRKTWMAGTSPAMTAFGWALKMRAIKLNRAISTGKLRALLPYTPGLSTWSSSTALEGVLVSRWVSRFAAFTRYPVHT